MTPAALRELLALAEVRKTRSIGLLDAALREDRHLDAEAGTLARAAAEEACGAGHALPMPQIALRHAWTEARLSQIRRRRAELAGEIAELRRLAATSLGKHRVLEHLIDRSETEAQRVDEARSEREAPPLT